MSEQPALRDRIMFAISVLETIEGEIRDDVLPEWFRHEWLHEELVPILRDALWSLQRSNVGANYTAPAAIPPE